MTCLIKYPIKLQSIRTTVEDNLHNQYLFCLIERINELNSVYLIEEFKYKISGNIFSIKMKFTCSLIWNNNGEEKLFFLEGEEVILKRTILDKKSLRKRLEFFLGDSN
jgi:hypothetical protein